MAGRDLYTYLGDSGYVGTLNERTVAMLVDEITVVGGSATLLDPINELWMKLGELSFSTITNLALWSQDFSNVSWTKLRSTILTDVILAPDSTLTADKSVEDTTNNTHYTLLNNYAGLGNTTYTWSIYAKAAERTFCVVQVNGLANLVAGNTVQVNLLTGEYIATNRDKATVVALPDGWFRISTTVTTTPAGGAISPNILPAITMGQTTYLGDGVSGIYVWGGQWEINEAPGPYVATTAAPASITITKSMNEIMRSWASSKGVPWGSLNDMFNNL